MIGAYLIAMCDGVGLALLKNLGAIRLIIGTLEDADLCVFASVIGQAIRPQGFGIFVRHATGPQA